MSYAIIGFGKIGHALAKSFARKGISEMEIASPTPPEFVAQGDRVLVVGFATGKIKATNKPFKDNWVFDITVRDGKVHAARSSSAQP
jgi:ketosteroid isomerase-like protein